MRLLLTADAVGGVWTYAVDLARALGDEGVETVIAVLGPEPSEAQRRQAAALPHVRLIETGLPLDWLSDGPAPIRAAADRIAALAAETAADIVQLNMPTLAVADFAVPTIAVTHGCVSTWWEAAKPGQPLDPAFHWHRALTGEGLRAATYVVAPSAAYAETVARHYGLRQRPHVVHNGRTPLAGAANSIADHVLTVGRLWDPVKGAALLDRVAARIALPFHAAGAITGPHGESVSLRNLHLLGHVDEASLAARLAARPIFVSAATFEPFGLAVLEAAAAGCALVLADIAVFRELWDGAALFVPADDAAGFATAITQLASDPDRRRSLGEAARQRAGRYTAAAMAAGMIDLYDRALTARRAAA